MTNDPRIDVIVIELVRAVLIDATGRTSTVTPDDLAVREAFLYAKSRPAIYAHMTYTATRIVMAIDRLNTNGKGQKELALELDPDAKIEWIWDAVQEFSKQ